MIEMRMKSLFFDRAKVQKAVDKAKRRNLSRAGAFIRTRARSSIRRRRKISEPGKPPTSQTGHLKRFLFFAWSPATESVVVGPERIHGATPAPEALEYGGPSWEKTGTRRRRGRRRRFKVRARPYMRPALEAEVAAGTIDRLWLNSVRTP